MLPTQSDAEALATLAAAVARFRITDRKLKRRQAVIEAGLQTGTAIPAAERVAYLRAVASYFSSVRGEATAHFADVDRRLDRARQLQFNLAAERDVLAARIAGTADVLDVLAAVERNGRA